MAELTVPVGQIRRFTGFDLPHILVVILLGLLAFVVLYPIFLLFVTSLQLRPGEEIAHGFGTWKNAIHQPGITRALLNTFLVTGLVQGISIPVAIVIAWVLARTDMPGANFAELLFWVTFFIPTLAITSGWILVFDPKFGLANHLLTRLGWFDAAPLSIYSLWGIVFTHLTSLSISTKIMMMTAAFRNMDATLEEAARISGAGTMRTLFRIVVPATAPMIVVACLLSLIRSFESFEIELVLGTPILFSVYSTKIYSLINQTPVDYGGATALSMLILLAALPLVGLQLWISRRTHYETLTSRYKPGRFLLGRWRWPVAIGVYLVALFSTVIPLVFLLMGGVMNLFGYFDIEKVWSLRHWTTVMADPGFLRSMRNTLTLGLGTMAVSVCLYGLMAYIIVRTRYAVRWAFDVLTWLPFTIPGIVLGLGYLLFVFSTPLLLTLYGSQWLLIGVLSLTVMTFSVQILKSSLLQLGAELEEAGRVLGGSWWFTFRRIVVPLMMPPTALVAVMIFGSVNRQVSSIVLLTTGDTQPLSVLQMGYLMAEDHSAASVVGTILVGLAIIVAVIVRKVGFRAGAQHV